ncbi:MAG: DUF1566 domain-containing protein, partial [Thermodesulfovibrionales bacterium]|nr:DUF1566 domain-containing protein [Thermodesulfovibrionales bacterium]
DGSYVASLVVNDGTVDSTADTVAITAATANSTPVANAGLDQNVATGSVVTLDGSGSSDANGDLLTYKWTLTSMPSGSTAALSSTTAAKPTFTADKDGSYVASLVVNDGTVDSAADTVMITAGNFKLPDTGQTGSYTTTFGEDSDYTINPPSYADIGNGTIPDNVTGLMWQKEDDNVTRTWEDAGTYCSNLSLGGQTDWRLPTRIELISIVNYGTYTPAINTTYFPNTNLFYYWSSTTDAGDTSRAWCVYFGGGGVARGSKAYYHYVRCVRGNSYPSQSFTDNGNGTITDNVTGLMWQKQDDGTTKTWESALTDCEGLSLAGYSNWRLPNIKELSSLVDDTKYNPVIDPLFTNTNSSYYRSSTTDASGTSDAWLVHFGSGYVDSYYSKTSSLGLYVRCVR